MKDELIDLLRFRYGVISVEEEDVDLGFVHGLKAYASYTADQISAAIGMSKIDSFTGLWSGPGVYNHKQRKIHLFSITIRKDDSKSETTKYLDGPVSETCFQWQSQSVTSENTETGRSYVKQAENGYQVLLFVRGSKEDEVLKIREPYVFIGKGTYVSHKGGKPMTILWDMDRKIPEEVMQWNEAWTGSRFIKPL